MLDNASLYWWRQVFLPEFTSYYLFIWTPQNARRYPEAGRRRSTRIVSTMVDERLFSVPEIADRLQVTEETVRTWLRSGRLRGLRPGGRRAGWRVRQSDLARFIEATTVGTDEQETAPDRPK